MANPLVEVIGEKLERINVVPSDTPKIKAGYKSVVFCFSNGKSVHLDAEMHLCEEGVLPVIRLSEGDWEMIKAAPEESKVDETKIVNNMRCCKCKLMKKPYEIVCDNCGGTIYEGFYDKELDEVVDEGKPKLIGVKVSPNGVEDILLEKSKIETIELEEAIANEAEKQLKIRQLKNLLSQDRFVQHKVDRPNPVAHVVDEKVEQSLKGILGYSSPDGENGGIILSSVRFLLVAPGTELDGDCLGSCNKQGNVIPVELGPGVIGQVKPNGQYEIKGHEGIDLDKDKITVSYDYEYKLPKDWK